MTTALREGPAASSPGGEGRVDGEGGGGGPARRAIFRWAWRLFRREWRQQVLVLALVTLSVAATVVGVALAYNAAPKQDASFGSANSEMTFQGADPADVAAARRAFGTIEVIAHQTIAVPGSAETVDLRAQDPNGTYGHSTLRLVAGRYPVAAGDIALTRSAAATFGVHVGDRFVENGRARRVVGLVEDPLDLRDEFALVSPGQADPPAQVTILFDATNREIDAFRPSGSAVDIGIRGTVDKNAAAVVILVLETISLLFVGLVAAAGFAVMAQRRLRALGMLGALGATDRNVRLAMVANGAVVGAVGSVAGLVVGLVTWVALAPHLEHLSSHRIDRSHMAWWALATAMALATLTAVGAAWWPARAAARASIVSALSGRPSPPKPAHRFASAGAVMLAVGILSLAFAHRARPNALLIILGTIATTFGMLFLGPVLIRALATAGRRAPIALRIAVRDLARFQARSAAALGAISLALAIAATVAISAAALAPAPSEQNLANDQAVVYSSPGKDFVSDSGGPAVPVQSAAEIDAIKTRVDTLATALHAPAPTALVGAIDPASGTFSIGPPPTGGGGSRAVPVGQNVASPGAPVGEALVVLERVRTFASDGHSGIEITRIVPLYVATPALLRQFGINPSAIPPSADIITSRTDLGGLVMTAPQGGPTPCDSSQPECRVHGKRPTGPAAPQGRFYEWHPIVQTVKGLPTYTSAPGTLLTPHALRAFGLKPVTAGWFVQTPAPLTAAQINDARHAAAAAGVTVETRKSEASYARLRNGATGVGLLVALGVLAMTVGLIRSETANDLRTLAATGASSTTRRSITGATAGALALLGALLGAGGAYAALVAWYRSDLHPLTHVPVVDLVIIVAGLPAIAATAGWLLAGREPPAIGRQPIE